MLKVLTWNILANIWFNQYQEITYGLNYNSQELTSFHKKRLENIIKTIKAIEPDILCLQEVTKKVLNKIKKILGYKTYYSFISNNNIAKEGVATLYNPLKKVKIIDTLKFIDSENEPNIYTLVKKDNKKYLILNVHPPRGGNCYKSIKYTLIDVFNKDKSDKLKKFKNHVNNLKKPFIICGDFNSSNLITNKISKKYKNFYWAKNTSEQYQKYSELLKKKFNLINTISKFSLSKRKKFYTTKKVDNIKDHEDHIFIRNNLNYNLFYGNYLKKFNYTKNDQGEDGLLYFSKNKNRKKWKETKNKLTSDHRWICLILI